VFFCVHHDGGLAGRRPSFRSGSIGQFDLRAIPEASGIVKSRRHPGIFQVHDDSER
jgi:hypothetical protein